jgi:phosphoribosyl-dephospho-CoA transferase
VIDCDIIDKGYKNFMNKRRKNDFLKRRLLDSRSKVYERITSFSMNENCEDSDVLLVVSTNISGLPKYHWTITKLYRYILISIIDIFLPSNIEYIRFLNFFTGQFLIIKIRTFPLLAKVFLKDFEKVLQVFDIDLFINGNQIDSKLLDISPKKCLICNNSYFECRKKGKHTIRNIRKNVIYRLKILQKNQF